MGATPEKAKQIIRLIKSAGGKDSKTLRNFAFASFEAVARNEIKVLDVVRK